MYWPNSTTHELRYERHIPEADLHRTAGRRDRDRLIHTAAFRRLAGVTQVVDPSDGIVFHNRLTHSLEVAQIGRSLAEKLIRNHSDDKHIPMLVDPDIVEAAALIHDLGHPPFGHVAEHKLNELARNYGGLKDGYEGNAQSFRIITRLSVHRQNDRESQFGLNLTRATLDAALKYPRFYQTDSSQKWGAYNSDAEAFRWARILHSRRDPRPSPEAQIMDLADDIAFSVHDMEDFYRAGLIPLDRLVVSEVDGHINSERRRFIYESYNRWKQMGKKISYSAEELLSVAHKLFNMFKVRDEPFHSTREQRIQLRETSSVLIDRYVSDATLDLGRDDKQVWINPTLEMEIKVLKELTWHYVIHSPALATQQYGKARIIEELFKIYWEALHARNKNELDILPERYREQLQTSQRGEDFSTQRARHARLITDMISSMTDLQATRIHQRLTGANAGSILDKIA